LPAIAEPVFIVRINPPASFRRIAPDRNRKIILPTRIHLNSGSRIQVHENPPSLSGGIKESESKSQNHEMTHRCQEASMKDVSIGAWRERTRLGLGLAILAAGAGLQLLQWLHACVPG